MKDKKNIELLAPAGSLERLKAAVAAGCDAAYAGGNFFGARAYAGNFTEEELLKAIDYMHIHDKKLYLTVNTLLKDKELKESLYEYLLPYYKQGIDGVIVQDFGVLKFIHENFKDLPIHGSTQMTGTMAGGMNQLKDMGVTRMVLSRELDLDEIKHISQQTDLEIEAFVHGALCYCYSGQCFMSSLIGGRSGNRGRCAQPCRMPYDISNQEFGINEDKRYILSPKDICTLAIIPELYESGIHSFKIEGRMKSIEYTALTVSKYRKYIDLYHELGSESYKQYMIKHSDQLKNDIIELSDIYNRGSFTDGYYRQHNGSHMISMTRPNHNGVYIGEVVQVKSNQAVIQTKENVNSQDVLEIRGSQKENTYEFTLKDPQNKGGQIKTNLYPNHRIKKGQQVYRVRNQTLINEVKMKYLERKHRTAIRGSFTASLNNPMVLYVCRGDIEVFVSGDMVEAAKNQPTSKEKVLSQLEKTMDTEFYFSSIDLLMDENVFLPAACINNLRRKALQELESALLKKYVRVTEQSKINEVSLGKIHELHNISKVSNNDTVKVRNRSSKSDNSDLIVQISDRGQLNQMIKYKEVSAIYFDLLELNLKEIPEIIKQVKDAGKKIYFVLPHIFRKKALDIFLSNIKYFQTKEIDGFMIRNIEEYDFLMNLVKSDFYKHDILTDYNMYTMNHEAENFWKKKGISHTTLPIELNYRELKEKGCEDGEMIIYGYLPVMVSAQCVLSNANKCRNRTSMVKLTGGQGNSFYVYNHCRYCYNLIYNGKPLSLLFNKNEITDLKVRKLRLIFTMEDTMKIDEIIGDFIDVYIYDKKAIDRMGDITKGHLFRGVE